MINVKGNLFVKDAKRPQNKSFHCFAAIEPDKYSVVLGWTKLVDKPNHSMCIS